MSGINSIDLLAVTSGVATIEISGKRSTACPYAMDVETSIEISGEGRASMPNEIPVSVISRVISGAISTPTSSMVPAPPERDSGIPPVLHSVAPRAVFTTVATTRSDASTSAFMDVTKSASVVSSALSASPPDRSATTSIADPVTVIPTSPETSVVLISMVMSFPGAPFSTEVKSTSADGVPDGSPRCRYVA